MSWFKSLFGGTRSDASKEVPKSEGGTPKVPNKEIAPSNAEPSKNISKPAEREPQAEKKESQKIDPRLPELMGKLDKVPNQNTPAGQMDYTLMTKAIGNAILMAAKGEGKFAKYKDQKAVLLDEFGLQVSSIA